MPGGTLIFEVELVHAEEGPRHPKIFNNMDLDGDKYLSKFEVIVLNVLNFVTENI